MRKKEKTGSVSAYMNQFGKYFRKNWQLYIIFLLPGLLLTLIFKYLPMLGIIIAFEEYSPFLATLTVNGSELTTLKGCFHLRSF